MEQKLESIKSFFSSRRLDLAQVWTGDVNEATIRQLELLVEFVVAWAIAPNREALYAMGLRCPPIEPNFDPESDWIRFEHWVGGLPLSWNYSERFGKIPESSTLSDDEVVEGIKTISKNLELRGTLVMIHDHVPARLTHDHLRSYLSNDLPVLSPSTTQWIDGCTGLCPECFQRPWCAVGKDGGWPQDKEEIFIPEICRPYL